MKSVDDGGLKERIDPSIIVTKQPIIRNHLKHSDWVQLWLA